MSMIPDNLICCDCGGLVGFAAGMSPQRACKCPDPFLDELEAEWAKEQAAKRKTLSIVTGEAA